MAIGVDDLESISHTALLFRNRGEIPAAGLLRKWFFINRTSSCKESTAPGRRSVQGLVPTFNDRAANTYIAETMRETERGESWTAANRS